VRVVYPGLIRAFDAMHLRDCEGKTYLLCAGDAAVPYRTTLYLADAYDSDAVCAALQADFEAHGAPLVLRMDRASAHRTPAVGALLDRWGVLVLHGPPHHPRFYGQLERQNREHRAWLRDVHVEQLGRAELVRALEQMRHALNDVWPRPSLGYRTAAEVFCARPELRVDRRELREEVRSLAQSRIARDHLEGYEAERAYRLAIEQTLQRRGAIQIVKGGWC
jgi:hypothetical protein